MGDVRVPAAATLLAALVAVLGSVFVVWPSGRQQWRLQAAQFADRAETRRAQWAEERSRAARAAGHPVGTCRDQAAARRVLIQQPRGARVGTAEPGGCLAS